MNAGNSGDSGKADAAGNKAADDREPGSGDYDPVKAEAKDKELAADAVPPVSEATEPPAGDAPAGKPKVQKAMQTREVKGVKTVEKTDKHDKGDKHGS